MKTKPVLLTSLLILCLLAMVGCKNTAEGVGKDMEEAGEKIQEKVD